MANLVGTLAWGTGRLALGVARDQPNPISGVELFTS